jgi:GT2 family glycosyltransferase
VPFPPDVLWPLISVVVCSYNGEKTIRECCEGIHRLDYPNLEVIVVDDGSTDKTFDITTENGFRVIRTPNRGLSAARNLGLESATGEIVVYLDDDAYPDSDWLRYLSHTFLTTDCVGAGGPNIPPPGAALIADCVANAPGGPLHVLISDREAEHIPGCNMAFRKDCLVAVGGFDPKFRAAGDDVDVCWRLQQNGGWLAFNPAAMVWHHRRNSVRAYWRQQKGYGKAEAMLERKWPDKYNGLGHLTWTGKIYGSGLTQSLSWRKWRIYHGTWGSAPFQSIYSPRTSNLETLPLIPEWYMLNMVLLVLSFLGLVWRPFLFAVPVLAITAGVPLLYVIKSASAATFTSESESRLGRLQFRVLTGLLHVLQPMARLYGRLSHGLTPWRRPSKTHRFTFPRRRSSAIWSESWLAQEERLEAIEKAIRQQSAVVMRGGAFDRWDLEVRGGLLGSLCTRMAIEEHGGGRQLVRLRSWPKFSLIGQILTVLFAGFSAATASGHAWVATTVFAMAAAVLIARMAGDYSAAAAAYLQALRAAEQMSSESCVSPPDQPTGAKTLQGLACLERVQGD